jgi:hypothetical protein
VPLAADLGVTIEADHVWYMPGGDVAYTVTVRNLSGSEPAAAVSVSTALAGQASGRTWWTAAYSAGGTGPVVGAGDVVGTIGLPAGGTATFNVVSTASTSASGPLTSTATVTVAGDPNAANNSSSASLAFTPQPLVVADAAGWHSTSAVRVLDAATGVERTRFFAFEPGFRGGVQTVLADLDRDGQLEILAAPGRGSSGEIRVFTLEGVELSGQRLRPFGADWRGGLNIAAGDVDGDGTIDVAAAKASGDGEVRVFLGSPDTGRFAAVAHRTIRPFAATFLGGATVAFADVGTFAGGATIRDSVPDGHAELLVGSGPTRAAEVQVRDLSTETSPLIRTIRPFEGVFSGGVSLATARVNADSVPDLIIAAGRRGEGRVEIRDGWVATAGRGVLAAFAVLGASRSQPAFAAAVDGDGDGRVDEFVAARAGASARRFTVSGAALGDGVPLVGRVMTAAASTSPAVVTTPTGLRYRDLVVGPGASPSSPTAQVTVNYEGRLLDGTRFDGRDGVEFGLDRVISGWTEGLQSMRVGGRRQLIIPSNLGYGATARPGIPANSILVFDVELLATT